MAEHAPWYVYVLLLSDGHHYVGMTRRLDERLREHQAGQGPVAVRTRLPAALVWYEQVPDATAARRVERWLKRRSIDEKRVYMGSRGVYSEGQDAAAALLLPG